MKALVYTAPHEMTLLDQPEPAPGDGEVVVDIDAVGICGSDMHAYQGHDPRRVPPLTLGHEVCGLVRGGRLDGRRVVLNPLITCGYCHYCQTGRFNICANRTMIGMTRPGGYAERVAIPEQCLVPVPDELDPVKASLTEPAATGLHALALASRALTRPLSEARALVIGAGSVGLLTALLLRHQGCDRLAVAESNPLRRKAAETELAGQVFDPISSPADKDAFDLVVDCVGGAVTRQASMDAIAPGGVLIHVGLMNNDGGLDARKITLAEITVIGAYTYTTADLAAAAAKLYSGAYGNLDWIESRPLVDGAVAFRELLDGSVAAPKVVLVPQV